jgi:hypothetical protein
MALPAWGLMEEAEVVPMTTIWVLRVFQVQTSIPKIREASHQEDLPTIAFIKIQGTAPEN